MQFSKEHLRISIAVRQISGSLLGLLCLGLCVGAALVIVAKPEHEPIELTAGPPPALTNQHEVNTPTSPAHVLAPRASGSGPAGRTIVPASITRSENPLATIAALRQKKSPGSFAQARLLFELCKQAVGSIAAANLLAVQGASDEGVTAHNGEPQVDARRTAALQTLEARCRDVAQATELADPLPDDGYGIKVKRAIEVLRGNISSEMRRQALMELANQGQLWAAYRELAGVQGTPVFFGGRQLSGQEATEYALSVLTAFSEDAAPVEGKAPDIRYLIICASSSGCSTTPSDVYMRGQNVAAQERIRALARLVSAAVKRGDIEFFAPGLAE